jgi:diaminohydroxyphosphoribosylaminopyrimidine deaminase/5-amino-6-(5-phosphoribosylamino)uracil reductase
MRRALQLARQGAPHTTPNPMVGAVVVCGDRIIGEGFHRRCGEAHAEVNAIAAVADRSLLPSSTLYVTLEPCSHQGRTPPCARLIIEMGIPRVVVGTLDPFERVSGRGVAMLREAGVQVEVGVLEAECRALNRRFLTAHTLRRPWVQLKWAQSADGFMAAPAGEPRLRLSSPLTLCLMHRERAMADAIVVGAGTILADDPSLTPRVLDAPLLRVVLDEHGRVPPTCRVLSDGGNTLVLNGYHAPAQWLAQLYAQGITSVMVEGGPTVLTQLIDSGLWDEARIETAPFTVGQGLRAPTIIGDAVERLQVDGRKIITLQNPAKSR